LLYGGRLNLAELSLTQKRNHILKAALSALPDRSSQLLSTLALLSGAVDYDTLQALNPHLHPSPDPQRLRGWSWNRLLAACRWLGRRAGPERDAARALADLQAATLELTHTVHDLERRSLLQYDQQARRYDLHPVIRGYAAGSLATEDRDRYGQRAVDYFSQRSRDPYERAETLDDVENALQLVHALFQIGRVREALPLFRDGLIDALFFNLEENPEVVSLLRPFFDPDWTSPLASLSHLDASYVVGNAAFAFYNLGELEQSLAIHEVAVQIDLKIKNWPSLQASLARMARIFAEQNHLAGQNAYVALELKVAELTRDAGDRFRSRYDQFEQLIELGQWKDAESIWRTLHRTGRDWPRSIYRQGMAEATYALLQFQRGSLTEECLANAEHLALSGLNRPAVRALYALRGEWHLERREWAPAVESLHEAIRMTREAHLDDAHLGARLALARFRLGHLPDARPEAILLSSGNGPAQLALAELWDATGDTERAILHARAAYQWASADGEPFVHRYQLDRARALLELLGGEIPTLAAFGPDWEHEQLPPSASRVRKVLADLRGDWLPADRLAASDVNHTSPGE
jgi:tetratricopeptide (TPR) repeat protein